MRAGDCIEIQLVNAKGEPCHKAGVLVEIIFSVNGQLQYHFDVGRTNDHGVLFATYEEIEARRRDSGALYLMDFNTKIEDCDTEVRIVIPSDAELRKRAADVLSNYGKHPEWATPWPANATVAPGVITARTSGKTRAEIPCELPH